MRGRMVLLAAAATVAVPVLAQEGSYWEPQWVRIGGAERLKTEEQVEGGEHDPQAQPEMAEEDLATQIAKRVREAQDRRAREDALARRQPTTVPETQEGTDIVRSMDPGEEAGRNELEPPTEQDEVVVAVPDQGTGQDTGEHRQHTKRTQPGQAMEAASPAEPDAEVWRVNRGSTVATTLEHWGREAGWNVVWRADYDWKIEADGVIRGNFRDAVNALLEGMHADPGPKGEFYGLNRQLIIRDTDDRG